MFIGRKFHLSGLLEPLSPGESGRILKPSRPCPPQPLFGVSLSLTVLSPLFTTHSTGLPLLASATSLMFFKVLKLLRTTLPNLHIKSPCFTPAASAGPPGTTTSTRAKGCRGGGGAALGTSPPAASLACECKEWRPASILPTTAFKSFPLLLMSCRACRTYCIFIYMNMNTQAQNI